MNTLRTSASLKLGIGRTRTSHSRDSEFEQPVARSNTSDMTSTPTRISIQQNPSSNINLSHIRLSDIDSNNLPLSRARPPTSDRLRNTQTASTSNTNQQRGSSYIELPNTQQQQQHAFSNNNRSKSTSNPPLKYVIEEDFEADLKDDGIFAEAVEDEQPLSINSRSAPPLKSPRMGRRRMSENNNHIQNSHSQHTMSSSTSSSRLKTLASSNSLRNVLRVFSTEKLIPIKNGKRNAKLEGGHRGGGIDRSGSVEGNHRMRSNSGMVLLKRSAGLDESDEEEQLLVGRKENEHEDDEDEDEEELKEFAAVRMSVAYDRGSVSVPKSVAGGRVSRQSPQLRTSQRKAYSRDSSVSGSVKDESGKNVPLFRKSGGIEKESLDDATDSENHVMTSMNQSAKFFKRTFSKSSLVP
eukprot:CAMPEP_0182445572 /NCGR_PEP_ID=MMETSP1172-20130603/3650_1 /TAXON_ID=708627 /ORGANISM="Timspurckia oligopyrenoides, Strain CCMP3278" /LENGTH=409 /DNA_ID=CAMNT_0024641375 /DNA_START=1458 /DNA_END=2687 /DNA_ORIENTATION=-